MAYIINLDNASNNIAFSIQTVSNYVLIFNLTPNNRQVLKAIIRVSISNKKEHIIVSKYSHLTLTWTAVLTCV